MGRAMRYVALLAAAWLMVACTGEPSGGAKKSPAPSTRLLAGVALATCTIKGDHPVQAQAPALCGTLQVPEDRSDPDGRQIGLRVAVVPAVADDPEPDPLFVLAGGPGDAATQFFAWLPAVFKQVHAKRDIVLVDQRGTGDSNALRLPEMPDTTGTPGAKADALLSAWAEHALAAIHADPRFYTTTVAADDLDAVRAALGYGVIDLYGTSYGGTLAQYYLRQHTENVRAAVLDGSTPVDVPVFERIVANSQAALDLLFRRCAEDPACHKAFPRLADEWRALLGRLATPVTIVDPESGDNAVIDQMMLAEAIHTALLTESAAAKIPLAIHLAHNGRWMEAAQLIGTPSSGGSSLLMADEILCSEAWARFSPAEVARRGAGSYAVGRELARAKERGTMCRYLPRGDVSADDDTAVRTQTPMLWLVGDGDPQDPPANLAKVAAQESHSRIVVMPAQEHVIGHLGCMPSIIAAFLDAGDVDELQTSCVADGTPAPPFVLG